MGKFTNFLLLVFCLHLLISLTFLISPSFLKGTTFSRMYNTYLLPGPFFSDDRITTTYNYSLSWKNGGQWSKPINPAKEYFNSYYEDFNPENLFISRYIKAKEEKIFWGGLSQGKAEQFKALGSEIFKQYIPAEADSIRITATKKYAAESSIRVDALINPVK